MIGMKVKVYNFGKQAGWRTETWHLSYWWSHQPHRQTMQANMIRKIRKTISTDLYYNMQCGNIHKGTAVPTWAPGYLGTWAPPLVYMHARNTYMSVYI